MLHESQNIPFYFFAFFVFLVVWVLGFMYWGKKRVDLIFQGMETSKEVFREKRVSGFSTKSFITRIGGARNSLDVIVTDTDLCVKGTFLPFSVIGLFYDLTLRIKLSDIIEITPKSNKVELAFCNDKGARSIVLRMNNIDQFVDAVKG